MVLLLFEGKKVQEQYKAQQGHWLWILEGNGHRQADTLGIRLQRLHWPEKISGLL